MKNNIHPCLWYNGNALEAATFYGSLFSNSRITADTPLVVNFELAGQKFMGLNGGPQFTFNPSISFFVICESDQEIERLWASLSQDGKVLMPLDKYPWSDRYAFLQDRFGLSWQLMTGTLPETGQKITPCFLFVDHQFGRARDAVNFYVALFPGSSVNGILSYDSSEGEDRAGTVKHAQFILDGGTFMAMDGTGEHGFSFNESVSFVVECDDQQEIDRYWERLIADGGQESRCGWLRDQFGISWQIIPKVLGKLMGDPDREKAGRVMNALMSMNKLIIADLVKAGEG